MSLVIRSIDEPDTAAVVRLVHELAAYERAPDECHLDEPALARALFAEHPALFGHVAEFDGQVIGIALWYLSYSTWTATHGIYLEDLVVDPAHRGHGAGRALIGELLSVCTQRGYARLEWSVLDWNEPARRFYAGLGAEELGDWVRCRLSGDAATTIA